MIHLRILEIYAVRNWFYTQNIPVGYFAYTHAYIHAYTRNIRKIYNSVYPIFCTVTVMPETNDHAILILWYYSYSPGQHRGSKNNVDFILKVPLQSDKNVPYIDFNSPTNF